jgi:hypothetical protein
VGRRLIEDAEARLDAIVANDNGHQVEEVA